ncbi:MAG TPA: hypothetical protein VM686_07545 [Polyangiaceae bacterium]|nr:hypothetical protein [Polyangiaceae bacterium]
MQKSAYLRVIIAGLLLGGLASASACGSSDGDDESSGGGSAGSGGSTSKGGSAGKGGGTAEAVECGGEMCQPLILPVEGAPAVEACCAQDDACGLDSSVLETFGPTFEERCQPRDQPGERDPNCPNSVNTMIDGGFSIEFDGCCRANGRCGYMLDSVLGVYEIGLGCVDSEPFLNGETPAACGDGAGGAPAGGGAGGADPGAGGASGAPSAPTEGGAAGLPSAPSAGAGGA